MHIRNTHLLTRLLIIIKPLALNQVNARELRRRLRALGLELSLRSSVQSIPLPSAPPPTYLSLELNKLQPPTIKLEYIHRLGRIGLRIRSRRGFDIRRMFSLHNPKSSSVIVRLKAIRSQGSKGI